MYKSNQVVKLRIRRINFDGGLGYKLIENTYSLANSPCEFETIQEMASKIKEKYKGFQIRLFRDNLSPISNDDEKQIRMELSDLLREDAKAV